MIGYHRLGHAAAAVPVEPAGEQEDPEPLEGAAATAVDEITITGSMAILRSFGEAVDLLASGAVDPRPLLSEPLPLEGYGDAVNRIRAGQGIKWHIRPI